MSIAVRAATPADPVGVRAILLSAFPTSTEADLVDALRASPTATWTRISRDRHLPRRRIRPP
jgi:predicted N-acetyltransferase YhbS